MDEQYKTMLLAYWHQKLDDPEFWRRQRCAFQFLARMAEDLLAAHIIAPLEWFELAELAKAAFDYYTEALPNGWRHTASDYAVYDENVFQIGSLLNNRYYLHDPQEDPYRCDYFAFLGENNVITTRTYATYGVLEERYIFTTTGQRLTMVERSRRSEGINYARLDDPDEYRSLIDAAPTMLETGNIAGYVQLWERHSFSVFRKCSSCWDLLSLREECLECAGLGFVQDGQCPSKLPGWLTGHARRAAAVDTGHFVLQGNA